ATPPRTLCSVPSGNFGNLTAGLMAKKMGLPVERFVAATNVNHVVPDYLEKGTFDPRSSLRTISNAMDVGDPSNFDRMLSLYHQDHQAMTADIAGTWFDDAQTEKAIVDVWQANKYLMDPHTSVGYLGGEACREGFDACIALSTAHPAKFPETIDRLLPGVLKTPERLQKLIEKEKQSIPVEPEMKAVKEILLNH
ncbi:threonine synthase, partial [Balneolaceae bacterium ANBcel3]|nr:threonine synthase [Balneolaceae bacterium ANBcel3]